MIKINPDCDLLGWKWSPVPSVLLYARRHLAAHNTNVLPFSGTFMYIYY